PSPNPPAVATRRDANGPGRREIPAATACRSPVRQDHAAARPGARSAIDAAGRAVIGRFPTAMGMEPPRNRRKADSSYCVWCRGGSVWARRRGGPSGWLTSVTSVDGAPRGPAGAKAVRVARGMTGGGGGECLVGRGVVDRPRVCRLVVVGVADDLGGLDRDRDRRRCRQPVPPA